MDSRIRSIAVSVLGFGGLSLAPKLLAIGKDALVAARYGTSEVLDAYLVAFVMIGVPVSVIVVAIQTTLIPALVASDGKEAGRLLGAALRFALLILILCLPLWLLVLPGFLRWFRPEDTLSGNRLVLAGCYWLVPYYFLNGVNLLCYGALQAKKAFWPNALLPGLFPISIMLALFLLPKAELITLAVGTVLGSLLESIALVGLLLQARLIAFRRLTGVGLRRVLMSALPLALGGVLATATPIAEQVIAYRLGAGSVSLLAFGAKVPAALNSLVQTAVGIVVLPHFAELVAGGKSIEYRRLFLRLSGGVLVGGAFLAVVVAGAADPIVSMLFERGAFTAEDADGTARVMRAYLFQLPLLLVAMVSIRALIAAGQTARLSAVLALQVLLGTALAYGFSDSFGVVGVATGTVVACFAGTLLLFFLALESVGQAHATSA